jgi:hypothetical protein
MPQNKSCHVVKQAYSYRVLGKSFNDLSCLQNSLPTWLSPSFALRRCCQLAVVHGMWKKMTGYFNYLFCSVISDSKYKIRREMIQQKKIKMMRAILCMLLLWQTCAPLYMPRPISLPFSLRRFSGRHVRTSVCPVRSVCRISLRCSSDRHACLSVCSIRLVCRISLRCSFDWRSRYLHVLAADLRLFSFSWDFDTPFALP